MTGFRLSWIDDEKLAELVERARRGEPAAFAELYQGFSRRVFGLCRHLLSTTEAAEDATSEVFLRVQRSMNSYNPALPFQRWLLSVASHYCVDRLRRRQVESRLFSAEEPVMSTPDARVRSPLAGVLVEERKKEVRAAVGRLPERFRLPLVLRYYSELSYEEIAATLGTNRNSVATLIFRAKRELRRALASMQRELVQ